MLEPTMSAAAPAAISNLRALILKTSSVCLQNHGEMSWPQGQRALIAHVPVLAEFRTIDARPLKKKARRLSRASGFFQHASYHFCALNQSSISFFA
jgi:hypothetical protein